MSHFGMICPPMAGHMNPSIVLARELVRRGHRVTFYAMPPGEARLSDCASPTPA